MPNPTTSKSNDLHQHERASPVDVDPAALASAAPGGAK